MSLLGPFRAALAWILCLGKPLPTWSEPERLDYQRRHLRFNLTVNITEGAFWWMGMSFASASTVIPLFVSKLTTSAWPLAVINAFTSAGWMLPQLLTSNFVEHLPHKKPIVAYLGILSERLPTAFWPLTALLAASHPALALYLFIFFYAWHKLGSGLIATAWQDMLANCFPVKLRGWLLAAMVIIGSGIGLACAEPCARLLDHLAFPLNFVVCFGLCALGVCLSAAILCFTREPVDPVRKPSQSHGEFIRELPYHVKADRSLRYCLLGRVLATVGAISVNFVTWASLHRWHLADSTAARYTAALMVGQMLGNLACAAISARWGHKLPLVLGWLCSMIGFAVAAVAPTPGWIYLVFVLIGITSGADFVSGMLLVMELASPERRATYTGLVNTSLGMVGLCAPWVGAALVKSHASWLFGLSGLAYLAAAAALGYGVAEPRRRVVDGSRAAEESSDE